jgi:hypothetical protein
MGRPTLARHRKFLRLVERLGGRLVARGALELLWDSAYESGNDLLGDLLDVELACEWRGAQNELANALLESGFIERREDGKLYVHDLWQHAPEYVFRRAERESKRIDRATLSAIRREAGRKGGLAKSSKTKQKSGFATFATVCQDLPEILLAKTASKTSPQVIDTEASCSKVWQNGATPAPSPTPTPLKKKEQPLPLPDELANLAEAWADWEQHRREIGHRITPTTRQRTIAQLCKIGVERGKAAIEHSIRQGYRGLFEPHEQRNGADIGEKIKRALDDIAGEKTP